MTLDVNSKTQAYIGKRLRIRREKLGLSQEEVGVNSGISGNYYAGIERGAENPTITIIENICKELKIKSSKILPF